jgi:hypothetical protein
MNLAAERSQSLARAGKAAGRTAVRQRGHARGYTKELTDCESHWEAVIHMTKEQWSQTCRRVLDRSRLLDLQGSAVSGLTQS